MRSILKNMKPQWKAVVLILLCLLVQAVCDLSLPAYTSSLIDVGIQSSGVEYAVPLAIRSSSYDAVLEQMTAEEAALWQESYVQNGDVYTRVGDADEKALDEAFAAPIAQVALAERGAGARDRRRSYGQIGSWSNRAREVERILESIGLF